MNIDTRSFGQILHSLRRQADVTQNDLAKKAFPDISSAEASRQHLGRLERGESEPSEEQIEALSKVLAEYLGRSISEVKDLLVSQPSRRQEVFQHIVNLQLLLDGIPDSTEQLGPLKKAEKDLINSLRQELAHTIVIMQRLVKLIPEQIFWNALIKWVSFQTPGTRLQALVGLIRPDILKMKERLASVDSIRFLSSLEFQSPNIPWLQDSEAKKAIEVMTLWMNALDCNDKLIATHYADPKTSWYHESWNKYREANLRAARRGVLIHRYFIYQDSSELDRLEKVFKEQSTNGIRIYTVPADRLNSYILDIAIFMDTFVGLLQWTPDTRKPANIDFFPIGDKPVQTILIEHYEELLKQVGKLYDPRE